MKNVSLFETVGGEPFQQALRRLNDFSRVAVCGLIASAEGAPTTLPNMRLFLVKRIKMEEFIVSDHLDLWPQAIRELSSLIAAKKLPRQSASVRVRARTSTKDQPLATSRIEAEVPRTPGPGPELRCGRDGGASSPPKGPTPPDRRAPPKSDVSSATSTFRELSCEKNRTSCYELLQDLPAGCGLTSRRKSMPFETKGKKRETKDFFLLESVVTR